jgi:hypothetical protein
VPEWVEGSGRNLGYNTTAMMAVNPNVVGGIVGSAGLILAYGASLWRIFKGNPGDRFIQSASITVMVLVVMIAAMRSKFFPDWVVGALEVLVYLLAFLSIFFMFQQGYQAFRRRKHVKP